MLLEVCGCLVQLFLRLLDGVVLLGQLVVTELRVFLQVCGGLVQLFLQLVELLPELLPELGDPS